jgi:hypothetical protein
MAAVGALLVSSSLAVAQSDVTERTRAARAAAADFGMTLIGELQRRSPPAGR